MKLLNDILYLEFAEMLECGFQESYLKKAKSTGTKCWHFMNDPADKRRVLIGYDKLKDTYKEKVKARFGDPYEYMCKAPIRELVKKDLEAEKFFLSYRFNGEERLPVEHIEKYVTAASWLKTLINLDKEYIKKSLNLTLDAFWLNVCQLIKVDKIDLPASYNRLRNKMAEYKEKGPVCLVDWRFGNTLAAKVKDELSESVLLELIANANQYDDVLVANIYNEWAEKNGYKTITSAAVQVWRTKRNHEIVADRYGRETFNNSHRRKVMRHRPTQPTFLWESDDNHLDWWFQGDKANEYRKIKGIIVTDSYNDYVLGWAISDNEMSADIVRLAYLNALQHIYELTGGWYLPFEIRTDQWNIEQLRPLYQQLGHYYDTPVGSKNRGWLENFFGEADWERSMKLDNNNYTGHNITAKTTGVNMEVVKSNKKFWPHISEAGKQMEQMVHRLRTMPRGYDKKNKSRQQEWLEAWMAMPEEKKLPITEEQMLLKAGFRHKWQNEITDYGVRPTIAGISYAYSVPPALYMQNVGKKVEVIYNPYDMNRVLITDNDKLRFTAKSMQPVAGCMADMQEGGRSFLNQILEESKADVAAYGRKKERRQAVLENNGFDTETIIKLGAGVLKEQKQQAELAYTRGLIDNSNYNPLDSWR